MHHALCGEGHAICGYGDGRRVRALSTANSLYPNRMRCGLAELLQDMEVMAATKRLRLTATSGLAEHGAAANVCQCMGRPEPGPGSSDIVNCRTRLGVQIGPIQIWPANFHERKTEIR